MIVVVAVASALICTWLRSSLGSAAVVVPWVGLAWTILFARHSRRAAFAMFALLLGAIDGLLAPARWTVWPIAYLLIGTLAFATRRILPARGLPGELVIGALGAAALSLLAIPFEPMGLEVGLVFPWVIGSISTGVASALLLWLSGHWVALRMRLSKVS